MQKTKKRPRKGIMQITSVVKRKVKVRIPERAIPVHANGNLSCTTCILTVYEYYVEHVEHTRILNCIKNKVFN